MKVLAISCSPRKGGNTEVLLAEALEGARECGAETEFLSVRGKNIQPCDGCDTCSTSGECHIKDDMPEFYAKMRAAQGIIFGTPVYWYSVTAQAKLIIDRSYALYNGSQLANKVGGVVTVATNAGHYHVWNLFTSFFSDNRLFIADIVQGFASSKGAIREHEHAIKAARELGRLVSLMVKQGLTFPEDYHLPVYRLVKNKYSLDYCPIKGKTG